MHDPISSVAGLLRAQSLLCQFRSLRSVPWHDINDSVHTMSSEGLLNWGRGGCSRRLADSCFFRDPYNFAFTAYALARASRGTAACYLIGVETLA